MATFPPTAEYNSRIPPSVTEIVANLAAKYKNPLESIRARFKGGFMRLPDEMRIFVVDRLLLPVLDRFLSPKNYFLYVILYYLFPTYSPLFSKFNIDPKHIALYAIFQYYFYKYN